MNGTHDNTKLHIVVPPLSFFSYLTAETRSIHAYLNMKGIRADLIAANADFLGLFDAKYGPSIEDRLRELAPQAQLSPLQRRLAHGAILANLVDIDYRVNELLSEQTLIDSATDAVVSKILQEKPGIVAFLLENHRTVDESQNWCNACAMKIRAILPDTLFVVAGSFHGIDGPSAFRFLSQNPGIDALILGDTECSLERLAIAYCRAPFNPSNWYSSLMGIALRWRDVLFFEGTRMFMHLDELPSGIWPGMPIDNLIQSRSGFPVLALESSRGCSESCHFCYESRRAGPFRERSLARVVEDMRAAARHGFRFVRFYDLALNAHTERLWALCDEIRSIENLPKWGGMFIAREISEGLAALLSRAGCRYAWLGVEFPIQECNDRYGKSVCVTDAIEIIKRLHANGIAVVVYWIVNHPLSSKAEEAALARHSRAMDSFVAFQWYSDFRVTRGTPIHLRPEAYGIDIVDNERVTLSPKIGHVRRSGTTSVSAEERMVAFRPTVWKVGETYILGEL